ncbi:aromatic ring-opening dioxygenase subunit LigA [Sphingopyxis sp. GC21]|uniref:aromatic ring-opening dioxygenase subunit LigA n=1 Tax=Sphingopyxis sp. GC21 TaxID=2933562 RepID=UPI0021E4F4DA|nr:aromatic ring-opening dioxygenase subunit LigA [Sphingopyxis sp. GC21]
MSLYQLSKLLYVLNREDAAKAQWREDPVPLVDRFELTEEERQAILGHDIGLLYVLGVNGQILMHFAALCGIAWADYLRLMREGVQTYGPVRAGLYAMTTQFDEKVAGL